jgi:ubiquinone/menaquinone biosynthesis C-methylase UbiE
VTGNHLDIGVGAGYFLDRCRFPTPDPTIVLLDINTDCLDAASNRLARYQPERIHASVLEPFPDAAAAVDSVSLTYLLHCLPGEVADKSVVLDHVRAVLKPRGVVFGATLLQGGVRRNWYARSVMNINNRRGIFSNTADTLDALTTLNDRFENVQVELIGSVATFAATKRAGG